MNRNLKLIATSNIIAVSSNALWIMYLQYFFLDLGMSKAKIGLVFSLALLFNAFGNLIGGRIADLFGYKKTLLIGYSIYTFPPLLLLTKNSVLSALVYPIMSFGSGIGMPAKSLFIVEQTEKRKGLTYMLIQRILPSIPPAVTAPIGAWLYEKELYDFAVLLGFLGLAISLLLLVFLKEERTMKITKPSILPKIKAFRFPILFLMFTFALDSFSREAVLWIVPIYLRDKGYSILDYGFLISLQTLIIAIGGTFAGVFVDKLSPLKALIWSWFVVSSALLVFGFGRSYVILALAYLTWKAFGMVSVAALPLLIEELCRENKATAFGTITSFSTLISIPAPSFGGFLLGFGAKAPFVFKAVVNSVASTMLLDLKRRQNL